MRREGLNRRPAPGVPSILILSSEALPSTHGLTPLQQIAELVFETIRIFVSLNDDPPIMRPRSDQYQVEPRDWLRSSAVAG